MTKSYFDYMNEITEDELYKGLLSFGLFSEKLPPVFSSIGFFDYCQTLSQPFSKSECDYIIYNSMRNTNVPRTIGIPNPMAYQKLCLCLKENWCNIKTFFYHKTSNQTFKVSRTHIRKRKDKESLFEMNYKNWRVDGAPETKLLVGSRFIVKADISTCFPSIYTHAVCWALVGKSVAKTERNKNWYNEIDQASRNLTNGETHGILIGPHTSNLISEIILIAIDNVLVSKGWNYLRYIDDYTCYVSTIEEGQRFINDLTAILREYDLPINHKKTSIEQLPIAAVENWVRQLNAVPLIAPFGKASYKQVQPYLDLAIKLMRDNETNAAIINYAIKTISKKPLTVNAKKYCLNMLEHLAIIYPYLLPLMETYVFTPLGGSTDEIKHFSDIVYSQAKETNNYEAMSYAIYFAIKYKFNLNCFNTDEVLLSDDCILKIMGWIYSKKYESKTDHDKYKSEAQRLKKNKTDFDRNWLFVYEVLNQSMLSGDWKPMKKAGVTFIRPQFL